MTWPLQLPGRFVCLVLGHTPLLERVRDAWGRPTAMRWICGRCRTDLGETVLLMKP